MKLPAINGGVSSSAMKKSFKILVKGTVQGVGFRPFIVRIADRFNIKGNVSNLSSGVEINAEGRGSDTKNFISELNEQKPGLAKITSIKILPVKYKCYETFEIRPSRKTSEILPVIPPDIAVCGDCLKEFNNPGDRRFHYPFINCTNCGPRFTIIRDIPYDRHLTTMSKFKMCAECAWEYNNRSDRRFHAQPNACPECGPKTILFNRSRKILYNGNMAVRYASKIIDAGGIIAVKGLGGFHLACNAFNPVAVEKLKKRKKREDKPLAIMVLNRKTAAECCVFSKEEWDVLNSPSKPVIILGKKSKCEIAPNVASGRPDLGIMLPYAPLHYLLLSMCETKAVVMTSANSSDEPLVKDDGEALEKLGKIVDYFLGHNRDIFSRCDDSVIRFINQKPVFIRRSRGYVPSPVFLRKSSKQVLACGAELKNTFAVVKNGETFLSQHIGDLKNMDTYDYYKNTIQQFCRFFRVKPDIVAHDLHPQYLSTQFALKYPYAEKIAIQHHHAHIASCMADNNLKGRVIGLALDGTGYGSDGNIWGGEFITADYRSFNRFGHFKNLYIPGGDISIKYPLRMAASYLYEVFGTNFDKSMLGNMASKELDAVIGQTRTGFNSVLTSSCGRLFDAVSAVLGLCAISTYEGQAAMELEAAALNEKGIRSIGYEFDILNEGGIRIADWSPVISEIVKDMKKGIALGVIAWKFHKSVASLCLGMSNIISKETGLKEIAFSGGVWQNKLLTEMAIKLLSGSGFKCRTHTQVPPNDGGICLGQAAVAIHSL